MIIAMRIYGSFRDSLSIYGDGTRGQKLVRLGAFFRLFLTKRWQI